MQSITSVSLSSRRSLFTRYLFLLFAAVSRILVMQASIASTQEIPAFDCHLQVELEGRNANGVVTYDTYRLHPVTYGEHSYGGTQGKLWWQPVDYTLKASYKYMVWWYFDKWYLGTIPDGNCGWFIGHVESPDVVFTGDEHCLPDNAIIVPEEEPFLVEFEPNKCDKDDDFDLPPMTGYGRIVRLSTKFSRMCYPIPGRLPLEDPTNEFIMETLNPTSLRDCQDYAGRRYDADTITAVIWDYQAKQCSAVKNETVGPPYPDNTSGLMSCITRCVPTSGFPYDSQQRTTIEELYGGRDPSEVIHFADGTSEGYLSMELVTIVAQSSSTNYTMTDCDGDATEKYPNAGGTLLHEIPYGIMAGDLACYALIDVVGGFAAINLATGHGPEQWCISPRLKDPSNAIPSPPPTTTTTTTTTITTTTLTTTTRAFIAVDDIEDSNATVVVAITGIVGALAALGVVGGVAYWLKSGKEDQMRHDDGNDDEHDGDDLRGLEAQDPEVMDDDELMEHISARMSDMASRALTYR